MQGKIAGVQVINSGKAGADPEIRVRGTNSINGYKPLYVVDGLFNDNINFLNPQDIESMEILKDPSSLAIFGVRGANGVIIITTKKAKEGQTRVNINGSFGFKRVTDKIAMVDAAGFKELYNEQLRNEGNPEFDFTPWTGNTDWQDEIFRSAWMQSHNVSLTGGSEGVRYNASLSYYDQDGILLESNYKRVQGRMGTTIQKKKLKIYLTTNYSSTTTTGTFSFPELIQWYELTCSIVYRGYRPVTEPDRPLNSLMDNIMDDAINNTNDYRSILSCP